METVKPIEAPGRGVGAGAWSIPALREYALSPLFRNAGYLWASDIVIGAVGFAFWAVTARFYAADAVGYGASAIAAITLIAAFSTLGLGFGLIRFLPGRESSANLINSVLLLVAGVSMFASLVFILGVDLWSPGLRIVRQNQAYAGAFLVGAVAFSLARILDQVFVATRTAGFVLVRNLGASLSRLLLVVVFASFFASFGIVAAFGFATAVWVGISVIFLLPMASDGYRPAVQWRPTEILSIFTFSLGNNAGALLLLAPGYLFTIMVLNTEGPESAAYFYIAWAISGIACGLAMPLSLSLFAEGSQTPDHLRRIASRAFAVGLLAALVPALALLVMAEPVLSLFGSDYASHGAGLLRILAIAGLPFFVVNMYMAVARVQKRVASIVLVAGAMAVTSLLAGYLLGRSMGLEGFGIGWLAGQGAGLVVIGVLVRDSRENKLAKE